MLYVIEDIGSRDYQEDRHSAEFNILPGYSYFAVFDGHGDDKVSSFLKLYFKDIVKSELISNTSVQIALLNSFKRLQNILPKNISTFSGSTALVAIKNNNTLYVANVGDSRAIISNNDKAVEITEDHKPTKKSEYDRILSVGGTVVLDPNGVPRVNGNLALSRAIGDLYLAPAVTWIPDIYSVKLTQNNKFVVMATDGLWDVYDNQEVVDFINVQFKRVNGIMEPKKALNSVCTSLVQSSRMRGSGDNITLMLLLL